MEPAWLERLPLYLRLTSIACLATGCLPFVAPDPRPITYERSASGDVVRRVSSPHWWPHLEVTAARGRTATASSQVLTTSRGEKPNKVSARDIALVVRSSNRYLHRVALGVAKRLSDLAFVDRVRFLPAGFELPQGEAAPDWIIALDLVEKSELWLPFAFYSGLSTTVQVTTSLTPQRDHSIWLAKERLPSPPLASLHFAGTFRAESTVWGYESTPAEFSVAAGPVSDAIATNLQHALNEMVEELGLAPRLPEALYGSYREAALPAALTAKRPRSLFSGRAPLRHHVSSWSFQEEDEHHGVLSRLYDALLAEGWQPTSEETYMPSHSNRFWLQKGCARLYVEAEVPQGLAMLAGLAPVSEEDLKEKPAAGFLFQYVECFTREEAQQAVRKTLAGEISPECAQFLEPLRRELGLEPLALRVGGGRLHE